MTRPDAETFLVRLVRIAPTALVRLRGGALWARLPWDVLVTRTASLPWPDDITVGAADLLAELAKATPTLPRRHDAAWHWPLPPGPGMPVETLPGSEVLRVAEAAEETARRVQGMSRMHRDALLDHVPIVVSSPSVAALSTVDIVAPGGRVEVSQRLVQAVVRMGFLGRTAQAHRPEAESDDESTGSRTAGRVDIESRAMEAPVRVLVAGRFVGLAAQYGIAWRHKVAQLPVRVVG